MSLKKITKYLVFVVVIIIIITRLIAAKTEWSLKRAANDELHLIIDQYSIIEKKTNDKTLKDFLIISEEKDTLLLSSLLTHPKLIYRFSELHCDSCILHEFKNLRKYITAKKLKLNDVIIICYYENVRNLKIFKRINKLQDFQIYNLKNNNLNLLEIEKAQTPYFFMINSQLRISNTFIPIKKDNKRTDNYFKKVFN